MAKKIKHAGPGSPASGLTGSDVLTSPLARTQSLAGGGSDSGSNGSFALLAATNTVSGSNSVNLLTGSSANDVILARDGNDTAWGGLGDDTVYGGNDDDLVYGGLNADTLLGEAGSDTLLGDGGDDSLYGGAAVNSLYGSSGNDWLEGGSTHDSLDGGSGADLLFGGVATGADVLAGGSGDDSLYGGDKIDILYGGDGADLANGGSGGDELFGGSGEDTLDYSGSNAAVIVTPNDGQKESGGHAEGDATSSFEHVLGSAFADTLTGRGSGSSEVNRFWGASGNDVLDGRDGENTLFGGSGADRLLGGDDDDLFYGGVGNDTVYGDDGDDTFDPGEGDDTIFGGDGRDYFYGSPGADRYDDLVDNDLIDYSNSPGAIAVIYSGQDLAKGYGGWAEGDTFTGDNGYNAAIGSAFNDTIHGYATNASNYLNTFFGGLGDDTLMPNLSNESGVDSLYGGAGSDWGSWADLNTTVTADLANGRSTVNGYRNAMLTGLENLQGSQANDTLIGDGGANALAGQEGIDSLLGGTGADSLFGGSGNDVLFYDSADAAIMGGIGTDTLVGTAGADLVQLDHAHFSLGGDYASIEVFQLGAGNDYFLGYDEARKVGFDKVNNSGMSVFGGSGVDYISMRGKGSPAGTNDYIDAGSANDYLWGGWGQDTMIGGAGNDNTYGGFGNDTIYGGAGFDVHYYGRGEGADTIYGDGDGLVMFWGNDALSQSTAYDGFDPSEVSISYGASLVTISFTESTGNSITFNKGDITTLNLFDQPTGDAGNSATAPATYQRDIWSAGWDANTQTFKAWTKMVDA